MGTDIHMIGERKRYNEEWEPFPIPEVFRKRNYRFFAALADVRNGFGVAGCYTHEYVTPLTQKRGWPADISAFAAAWEAGEVSDDDPLLQAFGWTGDHSFGYATLSELRGYDFTQGIIAGGLIERSVYDVWNKVGSPDSWCGDASGPNIDVVDEQEYAKGNFDPEKFVYIRCKWEAPLVDDAFIQKFIQYLDNWRHWSDQDGSAVRILFNFDS